MTAPDAFRLLGFYATPPHRCSYLPARDAVTVFADPDFPKDARVYSLLSRYGFRRSGAHIYRPRCPGCRACLPVRVPVAEFVPRRTQRRVWARNQDLVVVPRPATFDDEHFALYRRYLAARHPGGGMDDPSPQQYLDFLTSTWSDTTFFEFRRGDELLAVAVTDQLEDGFSAVYTFYEPAVRRRSLGTYAVLWEIAEARRRRLDWLYLGYWIPDCQKMAYKRDFQPAELFADGRWYRPETE